MTFRQQAEQIVSDARFLREDDALALIEARLKLLFAEGERSGIEECRRRLSPEMQEAAE